MVDFNPCSLLHKAAAYITLPWWLALIRSYKLALGNRAPVLKILSRYLHPHLSTEQLPFSLHGEAQWSRLGAEPDVSMALVRNLNFIASERYKEIKPQAGLGNVTHMEWQLDVTHKGISEQVSAWIAAACVIAFIHCLCHFSHLKSMGWVVLNLLSTLFQL